MFKDCKVYLSAVFTLLSQFVEMPNYTRQDLHLNIMSAFYKEFPKLKYGGKTADIWFCYKTFGFWMIGSCLGKHN